VDDTVGVDDRGRLQVVRRHSLSLHGEHRLRDLLEAAAVECERDVETRDATCKEIVSRLDVRCAVAVGHVMGVVSGGRGGDLVVKGKVGARTGIDQKGGTIVVLGDAGTMTGFMMQRGRQVICGNVGSGLGDSMYDGTIYVAGTVKSLGIDCVPGEWGETDTELIERKFQIYGLGDPPEFQKFVCGKKLYNYDNLEPSERKLVL